MRPVSSCGLHEWKKGMDCRNAGGHVYVQCRLRWSCWRWVRKFGDSGNRGAVSVASYRLNVSITMSKCIVETSNISKKKNQKKVCVITSKI